MLLLSSASSEALPVAVPPAHSPTAAAAGGDGVAVVGETVAGLRRHMVKNAAVHWHQHQQPLLPEMRDAQRQRHADQTDQARMLKLMHGSGGGDPQQLAGQKQHKSMVVRGFDMLKHHIRPLLPVTESDDVAGRSKGLMSKLIKD